MSNFSILTNKNLILSLFYMYFLWMIWNSLSFVVIWRFETKIRFTIDLFSKLFWFKNIEDTTLSRFDLHLNCLYLVKIWFFAITFFWFKFQGQDFNHIFTETFYIEIRKNFFFKNWYFYQNIGSAQIWQNMSVHTLHSSNSQSAHESDVSQDAKYIQ